MGDNVGVESPLSRRQWLQGVSSLGVLGLPACSVIPHDPKPGIRHFAPADTSMLPPPAPREFRGAWVATVANIDWPSRKGLSSAVQQAEMRALLDRAAALQLNAIILQVRPCADAFYASDLEPWSEYLSGTQGQAPAPWYDPLALWISEAHARGLELHAWFNPFRARQGEGKGASALHVTQSRPQWVKTYGNQSWMDPGEPAAAEHSLAVILDVVRRYDVDGIHLDDYFYPYPVQQADDVKAEQEFPDQASWQRYVQVGGTLARDDWRRSNVNSLVQRLAQGIHLLKPWVRFGISPFGLGRPDLRPAGIQGFSQYHKLYADVEHWLRAGWLDYLVPQLYWPIDQKEQAFVPLLDYWHRQNTQGRHVWAGLFTSRVLATGAAAAGRVSWPPDEIVRQIAATRQQTLPSGHVHFSMVALQQNRQGLTDVLRADTYAVAALVPASPWLERDVPLAPRATATALMGTQGLWHISLELPPTSKPALRWAVWLRYGAAWVFRISLDAEFTAPARRQQGSNSTGEPVLSAMVVSAIDRIGQESPRVAVNLDQIAPEPAEILSIKLSK